MRQLVKRWVIVKFNMRGGSVGHWDGKGFGYFWNRKGLFASEEDAERNLMNAGDKMVGATVISVWDYEDMDIGSGAGSAAGKED